MSSSYNCCICLRYCSLLTSKVRVVNEVSDYCCYKFIYLNFSVKSFVS